MRKLIALIGVVYMVVLSDAHELPEPYTETCIIGKENKYDPKRAKEVQWFNVDLDQPAKTRWREIAAKYKFQIVELIQVIKELSFPFFHGKLIQWVDKNMSPWGKRLPQPYQDEIKGIAEEVGLPVGELVLYNIFYEIFTVCTSIVAEDPTGKLYHARNLDFGLFMGWNETNHSWELTQRLHDMVVNVNWMKNGKLLYKSNNFAGFVGIYNAVRPGLFTVTANERFNIDGGYVGLIMWLLGVGESKWMSWATREVVEQAKSYQEAVKRFTTEKLMSPVYFIVGGNKTGQGCIISRGRTKTESIVTLDARKENGWYVLQTNYDPDKPPLYLDDRRTPGNKCMQKMGQNHLGFPGLFNVLSSTTNLNKLTAYTVLMQVNTAKFETYLQTCTESCWFA